MRRVQPIFSWMTWQSLLSSLSFRRAYCATWESHLMLPASSWDFVFWSREDLIFLYIFLYSFLRITRKDRKTPSSPQSGTPPKRGIIHFFSHLMGKSFDGIFWIEKILGCFFYFLQASLTIFNFSFFVKSSKDHLALVFTVKTIEIKAAG